MILPLSSRPTNSTKRILLGRVYLLSFIITTFFLTLSLTCLSLDIDPRASFSNIVEFASSAQWKFKGNSDVDTAVRTKPKYLGVLDNIYVISLPTRYDRRVEMEKLRLGLGVEWTYLDAFPAEKDMVDSIVGGVAAARETALNASSSPFQWPAIDESLVHSDTYIDLWSGDAWYPSAEPTSFPSLVQCAQRDFEFASNSSTIPEHLILTPGRVACWRSHLEAIHRIANAPVMGDSMQATLIMEDDVDAEKDLGPQLQRIWPALPKDWDAVYLGHCWSNETFWPSIPIAEPNHSSFDSPTTFQPSLHRSQAPKCNHGYVLSRTGARRILLYLRYPLFAYSRAVDQALGWLIESGRLKSFSVVPSVVVQRKASKSDIMVLDGEENAGWKDWLHDGFFGDNKKLAAVRD